MVNGLATFIKQNSIETRNINGHKHLVLYKAVRMDFGSWWLRFNGHDAGGKDKGAYAPGMTVKCRKWSSDRNYDCGRGLHVATYFRACHFARYERMRIIEVLVKPSDVVCVPYFTNGKIRCKRLKVVRTVSRRGGIYK